MTPITATKSNVLTGSSVLYNDSFRKISGAAIGFIGNHTSLMNDGVSTISRLISSEACKVECIFAPEHGAFGSYDENFNDEIDAVTRLPIFSLYGQNRKPTAEMLNGIDILVFELQDVGARFYTYSATLLLAIDAANEFNKKVLVLDRPNPLNGIITEGPVADIDELSFVAPYTIPIRTGLTLGELGRVYAHETGKEDSLEVVRMSGWKRSFYFDETGLGWNAPSPAMKSLNTAIVYPGVCLCEQINVSVGRGTSTPFEVVGAPYVDANEWSQAINDQCLQGVSVFPISFVPSSSKFTGEICHGVRIVVNSRDEFRPVLLGISMISTLYKLYGDKIDVQSAKLLLASEKTLSYVVSGLRPNDIADSWNRSLEIWHNRCEHYRLY